MLFDFTSTRFPPEFFRLTRLTRLTRFFLPMPSITHNLNLSVF